MSHPVPGHDYSEKTYPSDSPHKDIVGGYHKRKLNKTQRMTSKWLKEAGKTFRKKGESPLSHIKRLTSKAKTKAIQKKKDWSNTAGWKITPGTHVRRRGKTSDEQRGEETFERDRGN